MRKLDLFPQKKLRGGTRYLNQFYKYLSELENLTHIKYSGYDYWNEKICIYEKLLTNKKFTKEILNSYIKSADIFAKKNKRDKQNTTIILSYPNLFTSEICVFYTEEYFNNFYNRNNVYQKWIPKQKGIIEDLKLTIPEECEILNFDELITDEDYNYDGVVTIIKFT